MKPPYHLITDTELVLASLLMSINILFSLVLRLGIAGSLLIASLRMVLQLLLLGYLLNWIFAQQDPSIILMLTLVMTFTAGRASLQRVRWKYPGIFLSSLVTILFASYFVTTLAVLGILKIQPWYTPQYLIPLLGMVLGNCLNGISLGLDRFLSLLSERENTIEARLSLGATRWEAAIEEIRDSLNTAMTPTINGMMIMGIVSLPGMMTGQILGGVDPVEAVRYQIVILFMIGSATALGALGTILLAYFKLFNRHHQLVTSLLERKKNR